VDVEFLSQNWYLILTLVIILALLLLEPYLLKLSGIKSIAPLRVTQLVNRESALVLDVCTDKEFETSHIPDAVNLPLSQLKDEADKTLSKSKDKPVIISCRSGNRSKSAAKKLAKLGFKDLYILSGGNAAWQKEKLPMTTSST
jgi:rhodanese-related sulfurtransferase